MVNKIAKNYTSNILDELLSQITDDDQLKNDILMLSEIKNEKMKEQDIKNLKFDKCTDFDGEEEYHYYTLEIGTEFRPLCLITNANTEAEKDGWNVTIFDYDSIVLTDLDDVISLVKILQKNIVKND